MRGSLGNIVLIEMPSGYQVMREKVLPEDPKSDAQMNWRNCMRRAAEAVKNLSDEEFAAWTQYVQTLVPAGQRPPAVASEFIKLAAKVVQVSPEAEIPTLPPTAGFVGDGIEVKVSGGAGTIEFRSALPNTEGIVTEVLVQPLNSRNRQAYDRHYRSRGFVDFSTGPLEVEARTGVVACAVRFVKVATGQTSAIIPVGRVFVG